MFDFTGLDDMRGWMRLTPPTEDAADAAGSVVISSRVRLSRNLSAFPYPGRWPADKEAECRERIIGAFRNLPNASDFAIISMDDLSAIERRIQQYGN